MRLSHHAPSFTGGFRPQDKLDLLNTILQQLAIAAVSIITCASPILAEENLLGEQDFVNGEIVDSNVTWLAAQAGEPLPFDAIWTAPTTITWTHSGFTASGNASLTFSVYDLDNSAGGDQITSLLFDGLPQDISVFETPIHMNDEVVEYEFCVDEALVADGELEISLGVENTPGNDVGIDYSLLVVFEAPKCDGDVTGNGVVDPLDSGFVLSRFNCDLDSCSPDCQYCDLDGNGVVDPLDSGFVLSRFGICP